MCIRVQFAPLASLLPWDKSRQLITLRQDLPPACAAIAVRAVLTELAVPQPQSGAVCWCGEPVEVLPRVPEQRRSGQVTHHGA